MALKQCEGLIVIDLLRRAGIHIDMISMNETLTVTTSQNVVLQAEKRYTDIDPEDYDVLILPGGKVGTKNLESVDSLKEAIKMHYSEGKLTCAICAAPSIFWPFRYAERETLYMFSRLRWCVWWNIYAGIGGYGWKSDYCQGYGCYFRIC